MKPYFSFLVLVFLFSCLSSAALAQNQRSATEEAAALRSQLADVEANQAELELRVQQLDEQMKPENIERSLAGVGSTKPEELRSQRRRQLEIEKAGALAQLHQLAVSKTRLSAIIATFDALAYQQSAQGFSERMYDQLGGLRSRVGLWGIVIVGLTALLSVALLVLLARKMMRQNLSHQPSRS